MAVGAFPLAKLGFLAVKQISKPIANSLARRAKTSRIFREWVCIPVAQLFHWYDVKVRMRILNLGKATTIPKLNEDKAIETGAALLSEFILLSIASAIVVVEYRRSSEKEEARQAALEREKEVVTDKVADLEMAVEEQRTQIRELTRLSHALADQVKAANRSKIGGIFGSTSAEETEAKNVAFASGDEDDEDDGLVVGAAKSFLSSTQEASTGDHDDEEEHGRLGVLLPSTGVYFAPPSSSSSRPPSSLDEHYRRGAVLEAVAHFLDGRGRGEE